MWHLETWARLYAWTHVFLFYTFFFAFQIIRRKEKNKKKGDFLLQAFFDSFLCAYWNKKMKSECWRNNIFLFGKRAIIIGSFIYFYTSIIQFSCMDSDRSLFSFLVICSYWISFIHKKYQINVFEKNSSHFALFEMSKFHF